MLSKFSDTIIHKFPYVIGAYFLLQITIRLITTNSLVIDESEQVMLTQYFAFGYNAQPPLYTWLQMIFFAIFGKNIFAISLLKNLVLFTIYIFTYASALKLTQSKTKAALSGFGLVFLPQIIWEAQIDQIHTVLLTASAAALFYFFLTAWERQTTLSYTLMGLAAACGVLAKYNFVIVLFALFTATVLVPEYRRKMLNRKLFITIAVLIVCTLPHVIWFLNNMGLATGETISRMSSDQQGSYLSNVLHGSIDLLVSYISFVVVFVLFFAIIFRKHLRPNLTPAARLLIIYIATTFIAIFSIVLLTEATNIKERWLQPYLFLLPTLAFLLTDTDSAGKKRMQTFTTAGTVFCAIVMLVIPLRVMLVDLDSKPHRENYPFKQLSADIVNTGMDSTLILAEDKFIGGNLKLFFDDSTVITPSIPLQSFTPHKTVLVVWQKNNPIDYLKGQVSSKTPQPVEIETPFLYSKKFNATFYAQEYEFSATPD